MATLAPLPSLPQIGVSQSTGTDYTGLTPEQVDAKLNSPMSAAEVNQAMGYNYAGAAPSSPAAPAAPAASAAPAAPATGSGIGGIFSQLLSVITGNLENGVFVLLGLLLIAAGIFSFKSTQTVINVAGKAGVKAAEVAAA